jgi:hypothetical protein
MNSDAFQISLYEKSFVPRPDGIRRVILRIDHDGPLHIDRIVRTSERE